MSVSGGSVTVPAGSVGSGTGSEWAGSFKLGEGGSDGDG